jgi:hypothetical protein
MEAVDSWASSELADRMLSSLDCSFLSQTFGSILGYVNANLRLCYDEF